MPDINQNALLEAQVIGAGRRFLENHGFVEIFPPRVVRASGACENIDTLFTVTAGDQNRWWLDKNSQPIPGYLAQTGQLYLEALVPNLKKTYCLGPSFRAENQIDDRHLTEFTMTEIEFAGDFEQLLHYIQEYIKAIADHLVANKDQAIKNWGLDNKAIDRLAMINRKFARLTYDRAIEILQQDDQPISWGADITSKYEKRLVEIFGQQPLFITHYPDPLWADNDKLEVEKFFNMLPDPQNPGRVLSADLLLPGVGEAVGSAARVHDPAILQERLTRSKIFNRLLKKGGTIDDFAWYLEKINQQTTPHAGCGFGMARIMQWVTGRNSIVDSLAFASNKNHLI